MSKYEYYLFDLGDLIKTRALEARRERDACTEGSLEREFETGRVMAFNEVISMMQQQAEGFEIPLAELRLDDIDPDRDLTYPPLRQMAVLVGLQYWLKQVAS